MQPNIIQLLPDHLANQIAAGEVIQRPASTVKELLENAIDAGASQVHLIIADAGKALVQVIDNGKGMNPTDARMAFERHATSKIRTIDDLFTINTMGFRGEALASIAAVAEVEIKTKTADETLGTHLLIAHSKVTSQQPVATPTGTSIAMKNLFFNVPARRNFLKSNTTELRFIIDEFTRIALANPTIQLKLTNNNQLVYNIDAVNLKQRITQLLGNHYNNKLVTVNEQTDYLNITGYVGKPETAKKTRGDQYIFVNNRFIKSHYLNHAISYAYDEMLQKDSYPAYFINLQLNPEHIDINVHPTKQEIKFTDEKLVYAFVKSAVKHALAQFSISPALDFSLNATIQQMPAVTQPSTASTQNKVYNSPLYQTFTQSNQAHKIEHSGNLKSWQSFYNNNNENTPTTQAVENVTAPTLLQATTLQPEQVHQLNNSYIAIEQPDGFVLVQQQYAHQRVIYHRLTTTTAALATQQSLFPETLQLTPPDAILLTELLPHFNYLGYQIQPFGNNTFVLQGTPAAALVSQSQSEIEIILEHYKNQSSSYKLPPLQKLSLTLCWQQSIKLGIALSKKEMLALLTDWYNTPNNHTSPFGKKILANLTADYLKKLFS